MRMSGDALQASSSQQFTILPLNFCYRATYTRIAIDDDGDEMYEGMDGFDAPNVPPKAEELATYGEVDEAEYGEVEEVRVKE